MATRTTKTSSYIQAEGFKDSAGTMYQYASAVNNLISGLTASASYSAMNRVFSGLNASVEASQINNIFSGLASTVTAGMITGYVLRAATADGCPSAAYATTALAASTALAALSATTAARATTADATPSASYAASSLKVGGLKVIFGSAVATNAAVLSVTAGDLATALYTFVNSHATGVIADSITTQSGVQWIVYSVSGATATQGTVTYQIWGNP